MKTGTFYATAKTVDELTQKNILEPTVGSGAFIPTGRKSTSKSVRSDWELVIVNPARSRR